jgi:twitching motility protein PilT
MPDTDLEKIIKAAVDRGASDLHIRAGDVFRARMAGKLVALTKQVLTPEQTRSIAIRFIPNDDDRARIDSIQDYDCSWGAPGIGRFRVNILRQRSSLMIVLRVIPFEVPTVERLGLPPVLKSIADADRGMILVTGVTGSGKSSTMAAILNHINCTKHKHVVTLEDPIEFLHRDIQCSVTQREIGVDTESFCVGLRAALRQDPDVIVIGEMRDSETVDAGMKAAETGRLLISTVNAPDAPSAVMRILAMFPREERALMRVRLAESLHAVVDQRLLPKKDGQGRVVACEVMVMTPAIRELMLEPDRAAEIRDHVAAGREQHGMQTLDQHLFDLVRSGEVEFEVALAASMQPGDFEQSAGTFRRDPSVDRPAATAAPQEAPRAPAKAPASVRTMQESSRAPISRGKAR